MNVNTRIGTVITIGLFACAGAAPALMPLPSWIHLGIAAILSLTAVGLLINVAVDALSD